MPSPCLFIRNDDVCTLDREFRFFFDTAMERGIPVVHAVIPDRMDQALVRFLCRAKEKTPHLLDIVQHGWRHVNHAVDGRTKYEFGKSRSLTCQRDDIKQGLEKMRTAFGEHFTSAFVPPYHGYDARTVKVLKEESFQVFSAGARPSEIKDQWIIELPVQISFSRYESGKGILQSARDVMGQLTKEVHRRPLSGVLTHHADFVATTQRKELTRFCDYIAALKSKEKWRVLLFSEILSKPLK